MDHYTQFWDWFKQHADTLRGLVQGGKSDKAANQISKALDQIDPDLAWELGPGNEGRLSLTISAEGDPRLREIVDALFGKLSPISGWELYDYRQPKTAAVLQQILASQGYSVDLARLGVSPALAPSNTRVNLVMCSAEFAAIPVSDHAAVSFFILDGLLGEKQVENWIGEVAIETSNQGCDVPLLSLPDFMHELISEM